MQTHIPYCMLAYGVGSIAGHQNRSNMIFSIEFRPNQSDIFDEKKFTVLKGQSKSRNFEAKVHQAQVKLRPKPLSNPDPDLNPNQKDHEYLS